MQLESQAVQLRRDGPTCCRACLDRRYWLHNQPTTSLEIIKSGMSELGHHHHHDGDVLDRLCIGSYRFRDGNNEVRVESEVGPCCRALQQEPQAARMHGTCRRGHELLPDGAAILAVHSRPRSKRGNQATTNRRYRYQHAYARTQTRDQQQVAYEFDCFKVCSFQCNVEWRIAILGGGIDLSTVLEHPLHPSTDSQRPCEYQRRCKAHDSCPTRTAIMSAALRSAARCIG